MDRMIYTSMSGAKAAMDRQDALSNNLANVSTNGFRAELEAFRSVPIRGDGASTRAFGLETSIGYDPTPGVMNETGRNLDIAMNGNAWLAVQALDGTEAYTRAGSLNVSSDGILMMSNGLQVQSDGGSPITIPANATVTIGSDGTVTAKTSDSPLPLPVGRIKLVTPDQPLQRGTDGLFRATDGNDLAEDPAATLTDGALEGSNVSPVETMVGMIAAARQFEQQMKLLQIAQTQGAESAKLLGSS